MHLLKTCSYRLNTEPVGIGILKSKRAVKLFCGSIVFYHLKISVAGASFFALIETVSYTHLVIEEASEAVSLSELSEV